MNNYNTSDQTIQNCIFSENAATFGPQIWTNAANDDTTIQDSLVQDGCPTEGTTVCSNVIDATPLFVNADGADGMVGTLDDNLRLWVGSPAINMGNNAAGLDAGRPGTATIGDVMFDLDGHFRIADGTVDMGPYEFGSMGPSPTPTVTPTATQTPTPSDTPTFTNTPTITDTAVATATNTATETATDTVVPTETATVDSTPTPNFDVAPDPVDGQVDAQDLLVEFDRIKNGSEEANLLFDFSLFWQTDLN